MTDECVLAYEPSVDGLTIRVPTDVNPARFEKISQFSCYRDADAAYHEIMSMVDKKDTNGRRVRKAIDKWLCERTA